MQASLEKKLKAANLQRRNADRANELAAVMRQVCCTTCKVSGGLRTPQPTDALEVFNVRQASG